jgi:hypothetical protein
VRVQAAGTPSPSPGPSLPAGARATTETAPICRSNNLPSESPLMGKGAGGMREGDLKSPYLPQSAPGGGGVQGEGIMSYPSIYATAIGLPGEPVAPLSRSGLKI